MTASAAAYVGLALAAVGQGVSYYGQQQAAKSSATFANLNAQAGLVQAQQQSRLATAQAALQSTQAGVQQRAGQVNAAALRKEADLRTQANKINLSRQMEDQKRFNSMLLARAGKSGTQTDTASPLESLVYSAELENQQNAETLYQNELQRHSLFRQAQAEELGADRAGIQGELYGIEGAARSSAYQMAGVQARLQGISGVQSANAASTGALGGLIGGIGNLGFSGAQSLRWTGGNTQIG